MKKLLIEIKRNLNLALEENKVIYTVDVKNGKLEIPIGMGIKFKIKKVLEDSIIINYSSIVLKENKDFVVKVGEEYQLNCFACDISITCTFKLL